jgi:hypothetical protein
MHLKGHLVEITLCMDLEEFENDEKAEDLIVNIFEPISLFILNSFHGLIKQ